MVFLQIYTECKMYNIIRKLYFLMLFFMICIFSKTVFSQSYPTSNNTQLKFSYELNVSPSNLINHNLPEKLSFSKYISTALSFNPSIKKATSEIAQRQAQFNASKSTNYPSIFLNNSRVIEKSNTVGLFAPNSEILSTQKSLQFNWLLADFGAQKSNVVAAEYNVIASKFREFSTIQAALLASAKLYFSAQSYQAQFNAAESAVKITERTLSAVQVKQQFGAASSADVLQAKAAHLQSVLSREKVYADLQASLKEIMVSVKIDATFNAPILDENFEIDNINYSDNIIKDEINRHPTVLAARSDLEEAKARFKAAQAELLPTISFSGGRFINGEPGQILSPLNSQKNRFSVTLQVPIFDGFSKDYKVLESSAMVEIRQAELDNTINNVANELSKSYHNLNQLLKSYPFLEEIVQNNHHIFLASEKRYQAGIEDILDLLNFQKEYISTRSQLLQMQASIRIAGANFLTGLGRFNISNF
jgi:outer membrane protein